MNIFNFIKTHISIITVVNEYTTLKKAGNYLKSRCPFHHEKTASFTVSPHKEIYYCFGCHTGGDVISFISKIENCSPIEAAQFLADRYNLTLPEQVLIEKTTGNKQYYDVCKLFAEWAHNQLLKHSGAIQYLQGRNITVASINHFTLGFFPGGLITIKQCIADLNKKNILLNDLVEAHILAQGKSVFYSPFEDRIIFPIKDHLGRFCGFGARVYKPNDTRSKYYNSRENDFFIKGAILFGLDCAKKSIQESGNVFLVEGYTDCIAMTEHSYYNTVATLGTACTLQHLKLLARYANYVYLLYDSDKAGQDAILRLTTLCWQANMELKVIQLPLGQDPASFLTAGNKLDPLISQARDIFEFFIDSLGKDFNIQPLAEKIDRIKTLTDTIRNIDDLLKQDILLQAAARTFEIPFESLQRERGPLPNHATEHSTPLLQKEPFLSLEPSLLEKRLFCAIISSISYIKLEEHHYIIDIMTSPLKEILKTILIQITHDGSFDFSKVFDTLSQENKHYVSKLLLEYDEPMSQVYFFQLLTQFQKHYWKHITRSITKQLQEAQAEHNVQKTEAILHSYTKLKKQILQPFMSSPSTKKE